MTFDVQVTTRPVAKEFKKMKKHLRRHLADHLPPELRIPDQPVAAPEIDEHLGIRLIHRKREPIPLHPTLISQRPGKGLTQRYPRIFDAMVFVDMQISIDTKGQIHLSMPGYLLQHMIKESQTGDDRRLPAAIDIEIDPDARLVRIPFMYHPPESQLQEGIDGAPFRGLECNACIQRPAGIADLRPTKRRIIIQPKGLAAQV